jgi:hypothetical protein
VTKQSWRRLETALTRLALVVGLSTTGFWMYLDRTRPTIPDLTHGLEVRLDTHGSTVYITRRDKLLLDAGQAAVVLAFAFASWIDIAKKPFKRDTPVLK